MAAINEILFRYNRCTQEVKEAVNVLYTQLEGLQKLRREMRGCLEGLWGALMCAVVMAFVVIPLMSGFLPALLVFGKNWFFVASFVLWFFAVSFINYMTGWRISKPYFDAKRLELKKTFSGYVNEKDILALRFVYEFDPDLVMLADLEWLVAKLRVD